MARANRNRRSQSSRRAGALGSRCQFFRTLIAGMMLAPLLSITALPAATPEWSFVSSPDWTNTDIADLSGSTPGVPEAPGWDLGASSGRNGVTPQMAAVYGQVISEMAAAGPELFLVAGDLINGRWYEDAFLDMFAPATRSRSAGIDAAGGVYYRWYRSLLGQYGFGTVLPAIGDHELGDDPWPVNDEKSVHLETMRAAFGREMVESLPLEPSLRGVPTRPLGTPFADTSYAYQHRNVLFVAVDVFRQDASDTAIHPLHGTVELDVQGTHLAWLENLLDAADAEPTIDHILVQIHTPVLAPVRMQTTSGLMLEGRATSGLWEALCRHDHARGGKVRFLFAGEVHAATAIRAPGTDVIQLVHGNPPRAADNSAIPAMGEYLVMTVNDDRLEARLVQFDLSSDGSSPFWQPSDPDSDGVTGASAGRVAGTLTMDTGAAAIAVEGTGVLELARDDGLGLHFRFDQAGPDGGFANTGYLGDVYYRGFPQGTPDTVAGRLGNALRFDGAADFIESGRGSPTEDDARSVTAWVKTTATPRQAIFSYGRRRERLATWFDVQLRLGKLQLSLGPDTVCKPAGVPAIHDGNWHHLAVVLPRADGNRCGDVVFYVDGVAYVPPSTATADDLLTVPWEDFRIGVNNKGLGDYFNGTIDDLGLWGAGLSTAEVRAMTNAALAPALGYDAADLAPLFAIHRDGAGSADVRGSHWTVANGLEGAPGDVIESDGRLTIVLDASGGGVVAADDTSPDETRYEAELAVLGGGHAIADRLPDYTGTGYVEFLNKATAEWVISVPSADTYELGFRYANGISDRKIRVTIDGVALAAPSLMPFTGAWSQWGEVAFDQSLNAGNHAVKLSSLNLRGPNVDHLFVRGQGQPGLTASPSELRFTVEQGSGTSPPLELDITAPSGTVAPVDLETTAAWISVQPSSGTTPLNGILVSVAPESRGPGVYKADIRAVSGSYADAVVAVIMTVTSDTPQAIYEAEAAALSGGYVVTDRHAGFTGTGYVEFRSKTSAAFEISVATSGSYQLLFRYAVGIADRSVAVSVDGSPVPAISVFPSTGGWTAWGESGSQVDLSMGPHTIVLSSPHLRGPDVDHLEIIPDF